MPLLGGNLSDHPKQGIQSYELFGDLEIRRSEILQMCLALCQAGFLWVNVDLFVLDGAFVGVKFSYKCECLHFKVLTEVCITSCLCCFLLLWAWVFVDKSLYIGVHACE